MKMFSLSAKQILGIFFALLIGIPVSLYAIKQQQDLRQSAWQVNQSASARCASNGKVDIEARFTTESGSSKAINVVVKDLQTNMQENMGTVQPGETKTVTFHTDRTSISAGIVEFTLTWANGSSGTDTKTANYGAVSGCTQPTNPPPTSTPVVPTNTPPQPTATRIPPTATRVPPTNTPPVPTSTRVPPTNTPPVPTGTRVPPTNTPPPPTATKVPPSATPTDIPPTIVIPTPSGTGCPVPGQVTNIRIICPICEEGSQ